MSYETAKAVEHVLRQIHARNYLMPAIQREFVWGPRQIVKLVDSLMRGYPVGSFLFWKVEPQTAADYTFYEFLTRYHERDHPFAQKAAVPSGQGITAILDGQQRLTALNIALYGTYADKKKGAWWNSTNAFPDRRLYLNLAEDPPEEELGLKYDLQFLTDEDAKAPTGEPDRWFKVGDVLKLEDDAVGFIDVIKARGIVDDREGVRRLATLRKAIRTSPVLNYFEVTDQDPDNVLEIFVRVNSGGTQLSSSDLLLSMATNQWKDLDAREEVRDLVRELNSNGRDFNFSKDLVLKTALAIADVDLRFKLTNFTTENMAKVESMWASIEDALVRAASLLKSFGYTDRNLTADSVLLPIAFYLHTRGVSDTYLTSSKDADDRLAIQRWVARSLIKRGIWGSGLDTVLGRIREVLKTASAEGFPVADVEKEMAAVGKSLAFDPTEIDDLLALEYGKPRTFTVLSILYPGLDLSNEFHEDHIFPKSRFSKAKLNAQGIASEKISEYLSSFNLLPNLQLLAGVPNVEKRASIPADWVASDRVFPTEARRKTYVDANDLAGLPLGMDSFLDFFDARKLRMRERLKRELGV